MSSLRRNRLPRVLAGAPAGVLPGVLLRACWYPVALLAGTLLLRAQSEGRQRAWLAWLSTDLHNLGSHPVRSLLGSALVCEGDLAAWMVLGLVGLAGQGARFGAVRSAASVVAVHVLATLLSQGVVAYRIAAGALPSTAAVMSDVGPSYLVVAGLIGSVLYGRGLGRAAGGLGFVLLAPSLFGGLGSLEVSAMGHVASMLLAAVIGAAMLRRAGSRPSVAPDPTARDA